jgi:hypothetical protein
VGHPSPPIQKLGESEKKFTNLKKMNVAFVRGVFENLSNQ